MQQVFISEHTLSCIIIFFAFTSLGGTIEANTKKGIYVFKLHGQIYHYLPDLLPNDEHPKYLHMYFYDAEHKIMNRTSTFPEVQQEIVQLLMQIMECNPYAQFFRSLREISVVESTEIHLNRNPVLDQRVYNAPTANEVAVIWLEETSSSQYSSPHIISYGRTNRAHRIMHYYGCYDPLQYPLLYPHGDCGWHEGLEKIDTADSEIHLQQEVCPLETIDSVEDLLAEEEANATNGKRKRVKKISCKEYYAFTLQIRQGNYLLRASQLFQQYIVDMYVKLENTRLDFFRRNQAAIRVRTVWKTSLFITITCNPNWSEIKQELAPGELAKNRPDLVARIFHAKLIALKKQIMEEKTFGEVAALIYVVEFQKRGLPHAHILLILAHGYKIKDAAAFDNFVTTEIPSTKNPHLREVVLSHMMHGPCMKHMGRIGVCKYGYPKPFVTKTTSHEDRYPMYKRRDTGETVMIRKNPMDNRWVIPYNPHLLALFDCHVNVEVCSTFRAVKYLYKYVYKGHDHISFNVSSTENSKPGDEIEKFQSGRGDESLGSIVNDSKRHKTSLTESFAMNNADPNRTQYLYPEYSEHYVWTASVKTWTKWGVK
ncbi:uncharacterized protein LOC110739322 [Chenopodium quinoa]|uniref:uncharacterized protein LOC110739322 n=1 Tax=Chenopodium quinoa TaxID=63459 RepID=UPI000B7976A1|nr:uncharacterized protein LOC110739322 [Chenopodium quinoa]